jgi:DNA-binding beta-propeller fold protein YncE
MLNVSLRIRSSLFLIGVLLLVVFIGLAQITSPGFVSQWGTLGNEPGEFFAPEAIDVGKDGRIYVADTANSRIQVFSSEGQFEREWGSFCNLGDGDGCTDDEGLGQFNFPEGLAIDRDAGRVYVVDSSNDRMQVFDLDGEFLLAFGESGSETGQFSLPVGVEVDSQGNIYVADLLNNRIQVFNAAGDFLSEIGEEGEGDGQFRFPVDIAISENNLYATDNSNHRVQQFDLEGNFVRAWGSACKLSQSDQCLQSNGAGEFQRPFGIAVDINGNVYVADQSNHRIQIFSPTGEFLVQFGSPCALFDSVEVQAGTGCQNEEGEGQFFFAKGIAIAEDGSIIIADSDNHRVQIFDSLPAE